VPADMTAAFSTAQYYRSAISRAQTCSKKAFCSKIREQTTIFEQKGIFLSWGSIKISTVFWKKDC
jgi:hypothetical protein